MAAVEKISSVCKIVSNAAPKNKSRLVSTNERWNVRLKPISKDLRYAFDCAVLQSNWLKVLWLASNLFLGEEHQIRPIQAFQIRGVGVEGIEERDNVIGDSVPGGLIEKRAKPVRAWASRRVHTPVSMVDF